MHQSILSSLNDFIASMTIIGKKDTVAANFLQMVIDGNLQVIDHRFVGVKEISGQTLIKLLDSADAKQIGINNLANGKPQANQFMLVKGIKLLGLQSGGVIAPATLRSGNYADISTVAGLQNGVLTVKSDGKNIVAQLPMSAFLIGNKRDELGYYHLQFPKPIYPDRDLSIEIDLGTQAAPANAAVKWELVGPTTAV